MIGIDPPQLIQWLIHQLTDQVMEGDINTGFGSPVSLIDRINVSQDIIQHKGIIELRQVHLL